MSDTKNLKRSALAAADKLDSTAAPSAAPTPDSPDEMLRDLKLAFALWLVDYSGVLPPKEDLPAAFSPERAKYIQKAKLVTKHLANQGVNLV